MAQPTSVPTIGQRISGGLGRVGQALFPADPSMTPEQARALQMNAILRAGIGMMSASGQGAGFGESLARGYGLGQSGMQQAYENARIARAETRAVNREERDIEADKLARERQQQRDLIGDARSTAEFDYRSGQDTAAQKRWEAEQRAMAKWRQDQIGARAQGDIPAGYRRKPDGTLEFIPGGPADPKRVTAKPAEGQLASANYLGRMEKAETLLGDYTPSTTDYAAALKLYGTEDAGLISTAIANRVISDEGQRYYQAAADWVRAKLRKESGAVISPSEMAQEIRTYFPVPGDRPETVKQKAAARAQAAEGMRGMAGPAASALSAYGTPASQQAPPEALEYLRANPDTASFFREHFGYLPPGYDEE